MPHSLRLTILLHQLEVIDLLSVTPDYLLKISKVKKDLHFHLEVPLEALIFLKVKEHLL